MKGSRSTAAASGEKPVIVAKEAIARWTRGLSTSSSNPWRRDAGGRQGVGLRAAALLRDEIMEAEVRNLPKDAPSERMEEAQHKVEEKVGPRAKPAQVARASSEKSGSCASRQKEEEARPDGNGVDGPTRIVTTAPRGLYPNRGFGCMANNIPIRPSCWPAP